jgi:hypothetical protein
MHPGWLRVLASLAGLDCIIPAGWNDPVTSGSSVEYPAIFALFAPCQPGTSTP